MWHFFKWLWPLLEPCVSGQGFSLRVEKPLYVVQHGVMVPTTSDVPAVVINLCPTLQLNILLILAVIGFVFCAIVLWGVFFSEQEPAPAAPATAIDALVIDVLKQLNEASDQFLQKET